MSDSTSVRRRSGFTLLEILLVIALIGSMASLFLLSLDSIARTTPGDALEGAFWGAVREARESAVRTRRTQAVSFEKDSLEFVIEGSGVTSRSAVSRDGLPEREKLEVVFLQELPTNSFTLVRGRLVREREIEAMHFMADGTCQPVTVEFRFPGGTRRLTLDPWTCAELLDSDEEAGRR